MIRYVLLGANEAEAVRWFKEEFGYDAHRMNAGYFGSARSLEGVKVRSFEVLESPGFSRHPEAERIGQVLHRCILKTETDGDMAIARYLADKNPIAQHHRPDRGDMRYCGGCDMGCSCEAASWPCSTARLIAEQNGYELPDEVRNTW